MVGFMKDLMILVFCCCKVILINTELLEFVRNV